MRRGQWALRSFVAGIVFGGASLVSGAANSADIPTKAPVERFGCVQAVDGVNGKASGYGGSVDHNGLYGGAASVSVPLGCEWGAQVDGSAASFDGRFLGTVAGHFFWRDPSRGLLGIYGHYTYWDQAGGVRAVHIGPEAEWYAGRWTLQGVAGVEFGNKATAIVGPLTQTFDVPTRFFDTVNLAYYLTDDFKMYIGHRYTFGRNAAALGGEWGIPLQRGVMAALFAEGRWGEAGTNGVWGGLKFYFGQKDKTLIRRNREDDPDDNLGLGSSSGGGGSSSPSSTGGGSGCQTPARLRHHALLANGCTPPPPPPPPPV